MNRNLMFGVICILNLSLFTLHSQAQELTLEACQQMARENYPAIRQYGLIEQSRSMTLSNASKAWLPEVSITGFGVGTTDLIETSLLGEMKNSVYGTSLTLNQVIYDGGSIGAKRQLSKARSQVEEAQMDVQLYSIQERVEQLFFGILTLDEQIRQVGLLQDNLAISEKSVRSLIRGGMANESDLEQVQVGQVQADQQLVNLQAQRKAYEQMLAYFIGKDLNHSDSSRNEKLVLVKPSAEMSAMTARPELRLYASQENLLLSQRKTLDAKLIPTVSAFVMASYHNRMLPVMKDRNLMAGVMVRWSISALYTRKNDIASLDNQREQIEVQRQTFLFNNNLQQQQSNGQIESLRKQMALDDKAVALRESILEKARKKVEMGTETINELLRDVNAVSEARLQKAIHEIQLLQEISKLNTIKGK